MIYSNTKSIAFAKNIHQSKKRKSTVCGAAPYMIGTLRKKNKPLGTIPWPEDMPVTELVQKWSDQFEEFTRLEILLRTFPYTKLEDGLPQFCPDTLGYKIKQKYCQPTNNIEKCQKCWNSPYHIEKNIGDTLSKKDIEMANRLMSLRFCDNRK